MRPRKGSNSSTLDFQRAFLTKRRSDFSVVLHRIWLLRLWLKQQSTLDRLPIYGLSLSSYSLFYAASSPSRVRMTKSSTTLSSFTSSNSQTMWAHRPVSSSRNFSKKSLKRGLALRIFWKIPLCRWTVMIWSISTEIKFMVLWSLQIRRLGFKRLKQGPKSDLAWTTVDPWLWFIQTIFSTPSIVRWSPHLSMKVA